MRSRILDIETTGIEQAREWLDPLTPPRNYTKKESIDAWLVEAEAQREQAFGLDPDCCRIVCFGYQDIGSEPVVDVCANEFEEREILKRFWKTFAGQETRLITFNGHRFDLPVILMRSIYLGVTYPYLQFSPMWRSHPHVDLFERLSLGGARKDVKSLRFYARRFGIPIFDSVSGRDIHALVRQNTKEAWEAIANHTLFDLDLTRAVAEKLGVLSKTAIV